jgi:hypothetical protein
MTFGPDLLIRCPGCRNIYIRNSVGSENSLGARYWSDGWNDAPMMPIPPLVAWCEWCHTWFFIEDAEPLVELPFGTEPGEHKVIPVSDSLDVEAYRSVLKQSWSKEREILLRIRLMWGYNHTLRQDRYRKDPATVESHDNLERLADLLDSNRDLLMLAEVHRELGEFPRAKEFAIAVIEAESEELNRTWAMRIIRESERRNIFPVQLNDDELFYHENLLFPECIDAGYYPLPEWEDVFAFADEKKMELTHPFVSVHFSLVGLQGDGWATFFEDGHSSWHYRYDRLFTQEEWRFFLSLSEGARNELIDFWEMKSYQCDQFNQYELNFYYRTLFRLHYGYRQPLEKELYDAHFRKYRKAWAGIRASLSLEEGAPEELLLYWRFFWESFAGRCKLSQIKAELVDKMSSDLAEAQKLVNRRRDFLLNHIDTFEFGDEISDASPRYIGRIPGEFFEKALPGMCSLYFDEEESRFEQYHDEG